MAATDTAKPKAPKAAKVSALELTFTMERETKGTIRFQQDDDGSGKRPAIGTLYITKEALAPLGDFKNLRVTVEPYDA